MNSDAGGILVIFYLLFGIVSLILAITWMVLPFIIISKFNQMIAQQTETNRLIELSNYEDVKFRRGSTHSEDVG
jgi:hypothetical protein